MEFVMRSFAAIAFSALFVAGAAQAAADQAAKPASESGKSCFFANQLENWKAPDDKTMYIRTTGKKYYRLDMAGTCPALTGINPHLVTTFRGSSTVCSHLDWDLQVVRSPGSIPEACIVKAMTELSSEEVKAIPAKFKP